ncbi:bacterioferritin-associated ferredoxin [Ectothiorhodospiraceae bacterium WFHF3C12]|nr:bacterioferritin-associated ferredoxin [Ectothiorhodospiraceae bacterium WFHF3C12]
MYVCVCHGITDRQVREAIDRGARKLRDLREELGLCTDCGKCGPCARDLLQEAAPETDVPALGFPAMGAPQPAV